MSDPVEAVNLMANPKPTGTRGWARFGDVEVRMTLGGTSIFVRNISGGNGCGVDYALPDLPAGDWCYGFVMASSAYAAGEMIARIKTGPTTYGSTVRFAETAGEHAYMGEFTITKPGVNWLFTPPKVANGAMSVKRFLLCTKEDWDTMRENDVQWFDGDGFLTGGVPLHERYPHAADLWAVAA